LKEYKCSICNDDGKCLNSPNHPEYEKYYDEEDMLDYLNCWGYIRFNQPEEYQNHLNRKYRKEKK